MGRAIFRGICTVSQAHRAEILFRLYPSLEQAYELSQQLGYIYHGTKEKGVALTKLARWYEKVEKTGFKSFNTVSRTIQQHYSTILNFFERRSTMLQLNLSMQRLKLSEHNFVV